MYGLMLADEALFYLCDNFEFQSVLDVGSGQGLHAQQFRLRGKSVIELDPSAHWGATMDIRANFLDWTAEEPFDLVWCSHVLEHQPNVNLFLRNAYNCLKPGGILAVTVPPWKTTIVGGHLTIWNAGLLMYNLILAGFNCKNARLKKYGYNISIIVRKCAAGLPPLKMDAGDIETLAPFFPIPVSQDFNGEIEAINWDKGRDPFAPASSVRDHHDLDIAQFRALPPAADDLANLLWSASCLSLDGAIAEFGVFQGRSLRALGAQLPYRRIYGLDSFRGLPEPWIRSETSTYDTGHFATALPDDMPENVKLVPGFFTDTIPIWRQVLTEPLALVHVDADLYSSAREVLYGLNAHIVPGTVIVFDELCDWQDSGTYPAWPDGEWKALLEWMKDCDRKVRVLSRGPLFSATVIVAS